jgi:hypothetical protein
MQEDTFSQEWPWILASWAGPKKRFTSASLEPESSQKKKKEREEERKRKRKNLTHSRHQKALSLPRFFGAHQSCLSAMALSVL